VSTFTETHATDQELVNEGGYTRGARGTCTCGWHGPLRPLDHRASVAADLLAHCNDMKETAT
jgi:hypothetical protein